MREGGSGRRTAGGSSGVGIRGRKAGRPTKNPGVEDVLATGVSLGRSSFDLPASTSVVGAEETAQHPMAADAEGSASAVL